jgi:hypothetical protein
MSSIESKVCKKINKRALKGKEKYGTTMERTDLSLGEWINHLQEELMDAAVYAEKILDSGIMTVIENLQRENKKVNTLLQRALMVFEMSHHTNTRQKMTDACPSLYGEIKEQTERFKKTQGVE